MTNKEIIDLKKNILQNLSKRQLSCAIQQLHDLSSDLHSMTISDRLEKAETGYKFLLQYWSEGMNDPERERIYRNTQCALYELADDCTDLHLEMASSNLYFQKYRMHRLADLSITDYATQLLNSSDHIALVKLNEESSALRPALVRRERLASEMFDFVFGSPRFTKADYEQYLHFLSDSHQSVADRCLCLSALSLNLFRRFDSYKVMLLIELAGGDHLLLRVRALVALVVVMYMYDVRWSLYPELDLLMAQLKEKPYFLKSFQNVVVQLITAHGTENVSRKVKEEIMPEMIRLSKLSGNKLNIDEWSSDLDFGDKKPEWQKELENSEMNKKIQEYSQLQMQGADVLHSTFSNLKSFPFFSDLSNWFLPFSSDYSELMSIFPDGQIRGLLKEAVADSSQMCDSDKYSFCFSLLQIPESQRNMVLGQLGEESEQIRQLKEEAKGLSKLGEDEAASNQYIQNLYRFFKLHPDKNSFFDIFRLSLNFYGKSSMLPYISDHSAMHRIAQYCFNQNYYNEALAIYTKLAEEGEQTADIWQKIGYSKQMLGDHQGALDAYLKADLLYPDDSWIIRKIANLYKSLKQLDKALFYYRKAADLHPDNLTIEMNIGHCYLELKDYERALNSYYKVELLDDKSTKALRPIAWTSLLAGKTEIARKYYRSILEQKPTVHDYMNAGHVELCRHDLKNAIQLYTKALHTVSNYENFLQIFKDDEPILEELGVDSEILPLLFDQIYFLGFNND